MNILLRQSFIIILIIAALLAIYFGSYLPYRKSALFISALNNQNQIRTVGDFKNVFDKVFNFYSPVGQEEVVKYLGYNLESIINGEKRQEAEEGMKTLTIYLEEKIFNNDVQHLLTIAAIYNNLWAHYRRDEYFDKAVDYYRQALTLGSRLPHALYSLFGLYYDKRDKTAAEAVAAEILKWWPQDERIVNLLKTL